MHKLQLLQNNAARLVYRLRKFDHVTPALISLHWLPVSMRPRYKLCSLVFKCLSGSGPEYLSALLVKQDPQRSLRSAQDTELLVIPRTSSKLGERAFSVAGPRIWNTLPFELRKTADIERFKKDLKNHFFVMAYQD